jgi:Zn-dependent protease with chaperone function
MDFFGQQDAARKRSSLLVWLYLLAVVLICASVAGIAALAAAVAHDDPTRSATPTILLTAIAAAICTALVIAGGSAYRIAQLRSGGSAVANALGGQRIDPSTRDPNERRILNVVEEMAIASGVPVPPVYIMPQETSINAFAAGFTTGDAVIGVTRGCVEGLTRDELQGVMAHEFSHILNGDMRLNIRLIGLINGIVLLSLLGHIIMRSAIYSRPSSRSRGDNALPLIVIGIALLVIGSLGSVMGRVIQAAVSRQREFLADAAAVQFTRNPNGIANALRRIGGSHMSGRLKSAHAEEANHMFFGEATRAMPMFGSALASHPPLKRRIRAIDPSWDGTMLEPIVDTAREEIRGQGTPAERFDRLRQEKQQGARQIDPAAALLPLLALAGNPSATHLEHAQRLIAAIPQDLKDAAHEAYGARAVVYALLLDGRDEIRERQFQRLDSHGDPQIAGLTRKLATTALKLDRHLRLPLLDMTLSSLAGLSEAQHDTFRANLRALIEADQQFDLFEWVTLRVLEQHLDERFGRAKRIVTQYYSLAKLGEPLSVLLSTFAHAGSENPAAATAAYNLGASRIEAEGLRLIPREECGLVPLDNALSKLATVAPRFKQQVLTACAVCAGADRVITPDEAELLRAVGDMLAVPTPPLLPGQRLA